MDYGPSARPAEPPVNRRRVVVYIVLIVAVLVAFAIANAGYDDPSTPTKSRCERDFDTAVDNGLAVPSQKSEWVDACEDFVKGAGGD